MNDQLNDQLNDQSNDRLMHNLVIQRIPGLTVNEKNLLSQKFECIDDLTRLSKEDIEQIIKRNFNNNKSISKLSDTWPRNWNIEKSRALAQEDFKTAQRQGIKIVTLFDPDYPPLLREIYDPPLILFYRGVLPNPELPLVAMVGTRKPSSAAAAKAYEMAGDFGRSGIPVVSGLALGIDAFSHRGNIDAGAPSIAVLGSGLDQVYPSSNRLLAQRILNKGGALLSEYPPQQSPRKWHFPARNRIISALARGTIIVEAPLKSGALITADFALQQNRDLWVCSVGLNPNRESGNAKLAMDGAKVIEKAEQVLEEWGIDRNTYSANIQDGKLNPGFNYNINGSFKGSSLAYSLARKLEIEV